MKVEDPRYYGKNTPLELKGRLLLEQIVRDRLRYIDVQPFDLSRFDTYFLQQMSITTDEKFEQWATASSRD